MTAVTPGDQLALACPACSPDLETIHEVLKPGGQVTVRCTECDHVHKERLPEGTTVERDVVVSQDGESYPARVDVPEDETLAVGEEFVLETESAATTVRITSLALPEDERVEEATAEDVETIWTRDVGNVAVDVTMHPADTGRDDTRSLKLQVPGDYEFVVGDSEDLGEYEFTVESLLVREDAVTYDTDHLERPGDTATAKDVKRLYARDESTTAWSAW
jgi:uncharacterized Zn finger protein